jgi:hypothetical protein
LGVVAGFVVDHNVSVVIGFDVGIVVGFIARNLDVAGFGTCWL